MQAKTKNYFKSLFRRKFFRINPDEILIVHEVLKNLSGDRIMIDVGAHFGGSLQLFAEDGWKIFAFEPDEANREKLLHSSKKFAENVVVDPRAVSNYVSSNERFYKSEMSTGISSLFSFHDSHVESSRVDLTTLDQICTQYNIKGIDFLKIDTEGNDLFVLQGLSIEKIKPRVIVCEFEDFKTKSLGYSWKDLAEYLFQNGFNVIVSEWFPIEQYGEFGYHTWRSFAQYPCTLRDTNAFGNLIATSDSKVFPELLKLCDKLCDNRYITKLSFQSLQKRVINKFSSIF